MRDLKSMSEEERRVIEARRAYQRQWRSANKDKVEAISNRFWLKRAEEQQNANQK